MKKEFLFNIISFYSETTNIYLDSIATTTISLKDKIQKSTMKHELFHLKLLIVGNSSSGGL